jgi:anti-anti-sigma factor
VDNYCFYGTDLFDLEMKLSISQSTPFTCVEIDGRLDTLTSGHFDAEMSSIVEKESQVLIDFSKCNYLSSNGIRSLIIISKKLATKASGKLILAAVPADVKHVLEMAGLHRVFTIADGVENGLSLLMQLQEASSRHTEISSGKWTFEYDPAGQQGQTALLWQNQGIAGYDELGIALGIGSPAEGAFTAGQNEALFITTGNCAAFMPFDQSAASDFRISAEPSQAGVLVKEACSFHREANAFLKLKNADPITWKELPAVINDLAGQINKDKVVTGFVVASRQNTGAGITMGVIIEKNSLQYADGQQISFTKRAGNVPDMPSFAAITLKLDNLHTHHDHSSLNILLKENISFENIVEPASINLADGFIKPLIWLFFGDKTMDAAEKRIRISAPDDFLSEPYKAFLARRLYKDSSRLELKALQGGFSAQTFHVNSWDAEGRKLRPTVLKIAGRDMITREASRCREYAMPYILNNSAMILGTEFYGESGALRYNFVGIGGEESKLKWLTDYYLAWSPEQLEPLFDKIFLQILKPWYGQAVSKTIYPYRDHDPTKTFFPDIYEKASDLLGVSADEKQVYVKETGRNMLNPYWVLKHKYPEERDFAVEYQSAICHGDLNMQNILLDQQMNVYLIDFSETRPRSVVSDFARLEAIFMTEFMPMNTDEDLVRIVEVLSSFYKELLFGDTYHKAGHDNEDVRRNLHLSHLMQKYALQSADGNVFHVPYFLAMLEWVLPVVCYRQATPLQKRLSFILAAILFEKLGMD